jgi:hypothetical protein
MWLRETENTENRNKSYGSGIRQMIKMEKTKRIDTENDGVTEAERRI